MAPRAFYESIKSITPRRLQELLRYDPATGDLFWRQRRARTVGRDLLAGTVLGRSGHVMVTVFGYKIPAQRLIWYMIKGDWPTERLICIDGDKQNLRRANWKPQSHVLDMTPKAVDARIRHARWAAKRAAQPERVAAAAAREEEARVFAELHQQRDERRDEYRDNVKQVSKPPTRVTTRRTTRRE